MALRATMKYWPMIRTTSSSSINSSGTMVTARRHMASSSSSSSSWSSSFKALTSKADMAPVFIVAGFVSVAVMIGAHTAKQQLAHNPSVFLNKKKRGEMIPEADQPTPTMKSAESFVGKSFLRKIAHIQDESKQTMPNPIRGDIYTSPRRAETLESSGVH